MAGRQPNLAMSLQWQTAYIYVSWFYITLLVFPKYTYAYAYVDWKRWFLKQKYRPKRDPKSALHLLRDLGLPKRDPFGDSGIYYTIL